MKRGRKAMNRPVIDDVKTMPLNIDNDLNLGVVEEVKKDLSSIDIPRNEISIINNDDNHEKKKEQSLNNEIKLDSIESAIKENIEETRTIELAGMEVVSSIAELIEIKSFLESPAQDDTNVKKIEINTTDITSVNEPSKIGFEIPNLEISKTVSRSPTKPGLHDSPFKSPLISNSVNLRIKQVPMIEKNLEKASSNCLVESLVPKLVNKDIKSDQILHKNSMNLKVEEISDTDYRHKRRSSVIAEMKIKKAIELEQEPVKMIRIIDEFNEANFCGITKNKNDEEEVLESFLPGILNIKNKVLIEKTNLSGIKRSSESTAFVQSKFFLNEVECNDEKEESTESIADEILCLEEDKIRFRKYLKEKDLNTKYNEGYKNVILKHKVVLGLFNRPKDFYSKITRERLVSFDINGIPVAHNKDDQHDSILMETTDDSIYDSEVDVEKTEVFITRRVDLTSDFPQEDFTFKKIDKIIN